jgi:hypothetical protein
MKAINSQRPRTGKYAMRPTSVQFAIVAAVLTWNAAVAQDRPNQPSLAAGGGAQSLGQEDSSSGRAIPQAPVGHRQPRANDVPSEDNLGRRSPEDEAIDRKLRICRDC